ncbi:MAG TPA: hypothetical protein VL945_02220 [Candidatus Saccharimonadales bacterium]|nr:hypothetical protein [Candidatus Saccharimonadales bacterium]
MPAKRIDYKRLVEEAIKALEACYPPDTKLRYAAAVLTKTGKIYSGSNYSSDTASLLLHAEQTALAHAAMHRDPDIMAIAVVGKGGAHLSVSRIDVKEGKELAVPCGMCRQLIWENSLRSGNKVEVVMANLKGRYVVKEIRDLVPHPWPEGKKT